MSRLLRLSWTLCIALLLCIALSPTPCHGQDAPFITVWDTENAGETSDDQIKIPGTGTDYTVIWEEVGNTSNTDTLSATDVVTITFPNPGVYRVKISGDFTRINFGSGGDAPKIETVEQWGDIEWSTMETAFQGAWNLHLSTDDTPDLSDVETTSFMFWDAVSLTASSSNIGEWDVSNVTDMSGMFNGATDFYGDISGWDVSNVTDMSGMFSGAASFNQDIGDWNTGNVTDMFGMFNDAINFNQDIGNWDTGNVTEMTGMFSRALSFNQDIGNWDVSSVTDMTSMFRNATSFDQDLGGWDVSQVGNMLAMLDQTDLSAENYDSLLVGWAEQNLQEDVTFGAAGIKYCEAGEERQSIIDTYNWTIKDAGPGPDCPTKPLFVNIEGTRLSSHTLPSKENTPKDAIPYPPGEKTFNDRVEILRYSADRVVLRARVRLKNSFNGSVEDISVEGTLDGQVMQTVIRDSVDTDGDGKIDALPFNHYGTGDSTKYADVLLVSSQDLESGAENLSFEATATTASGTESQTTENISLYYAEHEGDGRPFDPQTDGYRFRNLVGLSFSEVVTLLASYQVVGGYMALYRNLLSNDGRCFGMAGTAGVYFDEPSKKVFSGKTYEQPESDTKTRQQITDYQLAQLYPTIYAELSDPDLPSEYSSARTILNEEGATPLFGIQYDNGNRHAILATKLTVLQEQNKAVFEVHDSNFPGTTYDLSYDIAEAEINPSQYTTNVTAFTTIDVDDVPFFPEGDWYRSIIAYLVDNVGEVFASTFTPSDKSARKTSASPKSDGESVYVVVENDQGQRAGFLADGTKVNEINGAVVKEIVTDSSAGEKATYVAVPPGNTYTASIATSAEGDIRFEHAVPIDSSTAEVNYAESVAFTDESAGTYDEDTKEIELDEDGDGTTDKTISTESSTLPVELTSFNARAEGQSAAVLTWQTASEENNAGFEVQHQPSSDERWKTLSFVESKASGGTTSEANTYRYAAEDLSVGTHQFRLKQVDLDGSSRVHGPVSVDVQMQEALKLTAPAPNPVSSTATLSFAVKEKTQATVAVYDMLGRRAATLFEGIPTPGESNRLRLNASSFPSGSYIIRLRADGQTKSQQVTVVR